MEYKVVEYNSYKPFPADGPFFASLDYVSRRHVLHKYQTLRVPTDMARHFGREAQLPPF